MQEATLERKRRSLQPGHEFYCKNRRRRQLTEKCLKDYLNANALERKRSACWRCFQGKKTRQEFSEG